MMTTNREFKKEELARIEKWRIQLMNRRMWTDNDDRILKEVFDIIEWHNMKFRQPHDVEEFYPE